MRLFFHREVLLLRMNNLAKLKGTASRKRRSTDKANSSCVRYEIRYAGWIERTHGFCPGIDVNGIDF